MKRKLSGSAIPRHYVFMLKDGTPVVQLAEERVQSMITGKILPYNHAYFGHVITDAELHQLKNDGSVLYFTDRLIWLYDLPAAEPADSSLQTIEAYGNRTRAFYITTPISDSELDKVNAILSDVGLAHFVQAIAHHNKVAIYSNANQPFSTLQDANDVLVQLVQMNPDMFYGSSVAVFEVAGHYIMDSMIYQSEILMNLNLIIQSQTDTTVTAGKKAVIVGEQYQQEKESIKLLLEDALQMVTISCESAWEALSILEDQHPVLAIIDLEMPDMHGWKFIKKIREIRSLDAMCIVVVSNDPTDEVFALKVAQVTAYLPRPVNLGRLREKVWTSLRGKNEPD